MQKTVKYRQDRVRALLREDYASVIEKKIWEQDLTYEKLSMELNISISTISRTMTGKQISLNALRSICEHLDIQLTKLYREE